MTRFLPLMLLVACTEPVASTDDPEYITLRGIVERHTVVAAREDPVETEGRTFPRVVYGCWNCTVVSLVVVGEEVEDTEREDVIIRIGESTHSPGLVSASIEGCSFPVSSESQPNRDAWALIPLRCGVTSYNDGFLLLHTWEHDWIRWEPIDGSEPQTVHEIEYELIAQIEGQRRGRGIWHTYACSQRRCP